MIHKTLFGSQQEEISAPFLHGTLPQICNNIPGLSLCVSSYSIAKKGKKKVRYILARNQANINILGFETTSYLLQLKFLLCTSHLYPFFQIKHIYGEVVA